MATLRSLDDDRLHALAARTLLGRAATSALRLDDSRVSGEHAVLLWRKGRWEVRDLGSRNGTFHNGRRLDAGEVVQLTAGSRLAFGHESHAFELADAGPPAAIGFATASGRAVVATDGILGLPSADDPAVVVYLDSRGRWVLEADGAIRPAVDGEVVTAGAGTWRIALPAQIEGTATVDVGPTIDTIQLRFAVSRDEEHVQITVLHRGRETVLEAREHAYTLLTLARLRLSDAAEPHAEQGWVDRDQLLKMLGCDANSLNVAIYRARGQLGSAGIEGAAGVVEVRRGQRRIGVEPANIEVVPL